jgi:hypothetical protein
MDWLKQTWVHAVDDAAPEQGRPYHGWWAKNWPNRGGFASEPAHEHQAWESYAKEEGRTG